MRVVNPMGRKIDTSVEDVHAVHGVIIQVQERQVIPAAIADVIVEMQVVKLQNIALIITKMQAQQEENHQ